MPQPIYKYAAIDAGSNSVKLLLCHVIKEHGVYHFKKNEFIRIPLRLGEDVFKRGKISAGKARSFIKTMEAFKLFIDVYNPIKYRACATASLREAANGLEIIKQIKFQTGLKMELITGREEAALIYSNHVEELLDHKQSYLYIDVGGGSTEVTLFDKGKIIFSRSFEIGTLRLLNSKVKKESWSTMKSWVRTNTAGHFPITAIGSGGNINRIFKILGRKDKALSFAKLKELYYLMKPLTLEDRMEIWDLTPDRADVIVPAAKIFLTLMKVAAIENIIVPQIGLVDGIIHKMHEEYSKVI